MLGQKIKKIRKEMDLSQEEFAKLLEISRSNLRDLENGKNKGSNIKILSKLSEISGKNITYFTNSELNIQQYDILDGVIEMMLNRNLIDEDCNINDMLKDLLIDVIKQEIKLKMKKKKQALNNLEQDKH